MKTYSKFRPTAFDSAGICLPDRQAWLVAPCAVNRDSDALARSNWACQLKALGGESDTVEVHRFGHWGPGWFEIVIINPEDQERVKIAEELEAALSDYPVIDDEHFSQEENDEAAEVWANCYNEKQRVKWLRNHGRDCHFDSFKDLRNCIRGEFFNGDCSSLLH